MRETCKLRVNEEFAHLICGPAATAPPLSWMGLLGALHD
jgi:hypothetical protein